MGPAPNGRHTMRAFLSFDAALALALATSTVLVVAIATAQLGGVL